jgi:hypothetical protein
MNEKAGSYTNKIIFIEAVRKFDLMTKAQCPKLVRYLRTKKGKAQLIELFKNDGNTRIHKFIEAGTDPVTVMMAYFTESSLEAMFATFPVNELQHQTLDTKPWSNPTCEAFRKFRFEIGL